MEGHKAAEKALALDDKHWAAHKWFAIMTSAIGDFLGKWVLLDCSILD